MSAPALQIGLALGGVETAADWARAMAQVERAEDLGLHSIWLPEMHFSPGATPSPLVALAAFAARTRRLRLGTTSLLLPIHPPAQIAEEVATLDHLSGGRVLLGVGRGFRARLFAGFGVEPASKRDRFDAALDAIFEAWRKPAERGSLRPLQDPHPPILVAAFGRKGLLQAARRGFPYLASPLESLQVLQENLEFHRENLAPGIDPDSLGVPVIRTVHIAGSDAEERRILEALEREARRMAGSVPRALARAAQGNLLDRVVVGTLNRVADILGDYRRRIGLDLLIARVAVPGASPRESEASLERLAADVPARVDA